MRAILFAAFALAACAAPAGGANPAPPMPPPHQAQTYSEDLARLDADLRAPWIIAARIGEIADLGDGLLVRPIEVVQDSRCPANVDCVWAGLLQVRVVIAGSGEQVVTLGEPVATPRGSFVLAVASPSRWHEPPTEPPPYRFGFRRV